MSDSGSDRAFAEALRQHQAGQLAEAESAYRRILETDARHADALHFLGVIALQTGHPEPALELIEQSIRLRPEGAIYRNNLGQVLERLGRNDEAARAYSTALALDPGYAEALNNLGRLQQGRDELGEAEAAFRTAIGLDPGYAAPHVNLGNLLKDRGDLDDAIAEYRRAIALEPGQAFVHSNLLLTLHYHPDYSPADLKREHEAWAARHAVPLAATQRPHTNDPDPNRRLRIGYVSPDFRDHAVARFALPVLERHDPAAVEIFAYADVPRPDSVTAAIRARVHHWRPIDALDDAALAASVADDRIDVLVDLTAHSGKNRLLAFARKPAPVQATWLAYCSTTGMDAIDYRLTDPYLDPPGTDLGRYTETSVHLPHCYWCYPPPDLPEPAMRPEPRQPGPPTFGCLNNFAKVTAPSLGLWGRILARVPDARLLLYAPPGAHRARVVAALERAGVAAGRVSFVGRQPFADYLDSWRSVDVGLDPFPYCGGTTTCDALWMGVPVVTLTGQTAVSRAGSSLLSNVGLHDLVAASDAEYVDLAVSLICDTDRLNQLRAALRERMRASPLMDARRFTRDLEAAFRQMWRAWCERRP